MPGAIVEGWGGAFLKAFQPRIDLVDEYDGTQNGEGRAFITLNLNWKHVEPFFNLQPTGRESTSIETFIFTVQHGKIVRWDVSDNSVDLVYYLTDRGWPSPHNVHPEPLVTGIARRCLSGRLDMNPVSVACIQLNNGISLPRLGLGVFQARRRVKIKGSNYFRLRYFAQALHNATRE